MEKCLGTDWLTILYLYARPQVWEVCSVSSLIPLRLNVLRMGMGALPRGRYPGDPRSAHSSCVAAQRREALSMGLTSQGSQQLSRQSESAGPTLI